MSNVVSPSTAAVLPVAASIWLVETGAGVVGGLPVPARLFGSDALPPRVGAASAQGGALGCGVGALDDAALAGHDGLALSEVSPAHGQGKVFSGHVAAAGDGRDGDGGDLGAQGAPCRGSGERLGDAGDGRVGVEQGCELPASGGGRGELVGRSVLVAVGPARKRDARPLHAQRPGVGLAVGGVVQHGDDVVEQVFDARPRRSR